MGGGASYPPSQRRTQAIEAEPRRRRVRRQEPGNERKQGIRRGMSSKCKQRAWSGLERPISGDLGIAKCSRCCIDMKECLAVQGSNAGSL
jgi:hypothetical protein